MKFVLILLFVVMCLTVQAQFYFSNGTVMFYPQDDHGNLIHGLKITINDTPLPFCDTCPNFANRQCYLTRMEKLPKRVRLTATHPQYLPFDDSINVGAHIYFFKPTDTSYIYQHVKVPMRKTGHWISVFGNKDLQANGIEIIERLGGVVLQKRAMCYFFKQEHGPYGVVYDMPQNKFMADSLLRTVSRRAETGPLYESDNPYAHGGHGLSNKFTIEFRHHRIEEAKAYIEQLKQTHNLGIYTNEYNTFIITVDKGKEDSIVPMIEEMLKTDIFLEPVMELYLYVCPG